MEILNQVGSTQFLFPIAAVAVVLVCAALVFVFGFHSAEQPQFDKLPLILDDRKSSNKKRKTKDKKSSPNRSSNEDTKAKSESSKKSPIKEKKEEKVKEAEKPKSKDKQESKPIKKEVKDSAGDAKKAKKNKTVELEKPADFDDGVWEEVPRKSDKKKVEGKKKTTEEKEKKKESPAKKSKKAVKDADVEAARPNEDIQEATIKVSVGPEVDEEAARALKAQVEEFQRVLKEKEQREHAALTGEDEAEADNEEVPDVKDLRSNKKKENKEKQSKKKANEIAATAKVASKPEIPDNSDAQDIQEEKQNVPVFDELGDTWTDAKVAKKGKKKARKDQ